MAVVPTSKPALQAAPQERWRAHPAMLLSSTLLLVMLAVAAHPAALGAVRGSKLHLFTRHVLDQEADAAGTRPTDLQLDGSDGSSSTISRTSAAESNSPGSSSSSADSDSSAGQCGSGPGPWREPRPLLPEAGHPFPASFGAYVGTPCAQITCRKDLEECPPTDKSCCTHWLLGLLEFCGWFFSAHGLDGMWMMAFGTMLGAFRNGTILPWDHDGDLMVATQLYNLIQSADNATLRQEAWRYGILLRPNEGPYVMGKVCYHPAHPDLHSHEGGPPPEPGPVRPFIDLFEARRVEGQDLYQAWLNESNEPPIEKLTFSKLYCVDGLNLVGPDDADDHLTAYYHDWRTPKKETIS